MVFNVFLLFVRFWALFLNGFWQLGHFGLCFSMVFGRVAILGFVFSWYLAAWSKYHGKTKLKMAKRPNTMQKQSPNSKTVVLVLSREGVTRDKRQKPLKSIFNGFWFFVWAFCNKSLQSRTLKTAHEKQRKAHGFQWFLGFGFGCCSHRLIYFNH